MLYARMADNQSQQRCTMDSLKEKDNPAPNPAKRPRIEVDEELMRQMIDGHSRGKHIGNGIRSIGTDC